MLTPREKRERTIIVTATLLLIVALTALANLDDLTAATQTTAGLIEEVDRGGQVITTTGTAQYLTVPLGTQHAWIYVKGANPVCWGFNPTSAPTANSGGEWPAGFITKFDNDRRQLQNLRLINCAEGATTVKILYTGVRRPSDQ